MLEEISHLNGLKKEFTYSKTLLPVQEGMALGVACTQLGIELSSSFIRTTSPTTNAWAETPNDVLSIYRNVVSNIQNNLPIVTSKILSHLHLTPASRPTLEQNQQFTGRVEHAWHSAFQRAQRAAERKFGYRPLSSNGPGSGLSAN